MDFLKYLPYIYFFIITVVSAALTIADKRRAAGYLSSGAHNSRIRERTSRISEKTLFLLAALGGAIGMYITMRIIHHKTKHKQFMLGLPAIIAGQFVLLVAVVILYDL